MNTHLNRLEFGKSKVFSIENLLKLAVLTILALAPMAHAESQNSELTLQADGFANPECERVTPCLVAVEVVKKTVQSDMEVKAAAESILNMMMMIQSNKAKLSSVKVPAYNYLRILQELQNRNARFLLPGSAVPATARAVFQLESEEVGLSQTVYVL